MPFWGIPEDVMREALEESFKSPVVRKAFVENLAKSPGAITGVKTTKSGNNSTTKKKRTSTRSKSSTGTRASVLETTTTEKSSRGIGSTSTSGSGR